MELKNRYDFMILFDVKDGNPNGDPDTGNQPRFDTETGEGLVTDVCLKRKIRNFVNLTKGDEAGYDIFVKEHAILNDEIENAYKEIGVEVSGKKGKEKSVDKKDVAKGRARMCEKFFDVRTFGAVLSTGVNAGGGNAGQVRGPVQLTFARSVDPIVTIEHCITRVAVTNAEDAKKNDNAMGRKHTVPYGLYVAHGFVSPAFARQTGFSEEDLNVLWDAIGNMFECDRSASRGLMDTRKVIVFRHDSALGNAHASDLFDLVKISRKDGVKVARKIGDYDISIDTDKLPAGVSVEVR